MKGGVALAAGGPDSVFDFLRSLLGVSRAFFVRLAAGESLSLESPRESNQREGDPDAAPATFVSRFTRGKLLLLRFRKVSSASAAAESLSLASPRESNQREGDPDAAPFGFAAFGRGFRQHVHVLAKTCAHPCAHHCVPDLPNAAAAKGAVRAGSQQQKHEQQPTAKSERPTASAKAKAGSWRAAGDARAFDLRPVCGGDGGADSPQGSAHGCALVCCQHMDVLSTNPASSARTRGFIAGATSGWPFSWLLLFGHTKRSDSAAAEADESLRKNGKQKDSRRAEQTTNGLLSMKASQVTARASENQNQKRTESPLAQHPPKLHAPQRRNTQNSDTP